MKRGITLSLASALLLLTLQILFVVPPPASARATAASEYHLEEYYFDGNEYIGVPKAPRTEKGVTMACFFKPEKESFKNAATLMGRWKDTDGYRSYNVSLTEDYHIKVWLEICAESSNINHEVALVLKNGAKIDQWQHLVVTYDGKDIKAYYNSVLDSDKIFGGTLVMTKAPDLIVGAMENFIDFSKGNLFKGTMRKVYIFNRAIDENEVKRLYQEGLPLPDKGSGTP
ncbi:MAG: LamG-like jellyroll fold domain-containing protein [Candidatus Eremiobacteraeota bacterium]|nr:LamG-like jellyroll fold domain-containing protein [Candidatus Eremiobacteraeota bacterium]